MWKRASTAIAVAVVGLLATTASAQTSSAQAASQQPAATPPQGAKPTGTQDPGGNMMTPAETRPATTTFMGDTGLWFVPTGEVLPPKRWSFSLYRVNFDYNEGFTDVSNWPITFGAGLGGLEIFGAVHAVRRIDRDARPIFFNAQGAGSPTSTCSSGAAGPTTSSATSGSARSSTSPQFDQKPGARDPRPAQDPFGQRR